MQSLKPFPSFLLLLLICSSTISELTTTAESDNEHTCTSTKAVNLNTMLKLEYQSRGGYIDDQYNHNMKEFPKYYDESSQKCVAAMNNPCLDNSDCPNGVECLYIEQNMMEEMFDPIVFKRLGACLCPVDMVPNLSSNIGCIPGPKFGESCNDTFPCVESNNQCQNNSCSCKSQWIYDTEKNQCVRRLHEECEGDLGINGEQCVKNAECNYSRDMRKAKCQCREGFEPRNNISCYVGHKKTCTKSKECQPDRFLACVDDHCICRDSVHQIYDDDHETCVSLAGSKCLTGYPNCTTGAECIDNICKCVSPLIASPQGRCEGFGQVCKSNPCNSKKGFACIDERCECFDSEFEAVGGKCVGTTGSRCGYFNKFGKGTQSLGPVSLYYIGYGGNDECKLLAEEDEELSRCRSTPLVATENTNA